MFRDFSNCEIEDFVFDESFQKWVTEEDSEHAEFWERFAEEHPHQLNKLLAARELVLKLKKQQACEDDKELADTVWASVQDHIEAEERRTSTGSYWWRAAAAAAIMLLGAYWMTGSDHVPISRSHQATEGTAFSRNEELVEHVNREDKVVTIALPDGSTVRLEKDTRLTHTAGFDDDERVVELSGAAFFEIEKDPSRPFLIFANETVVKVLGTSFRVQAHNTSEKVVVTVKSGKVSLFERKEFNRVQGNPQMSGLVLTANQRGEFLNSLGKFRKTVVPEAALLGNVDKSEFHFDQTPLSDVFETLERSYGIEIIYDKELMESRLLKVSLEDETLLEKLDIICQTMGLTYYMIDARIVIETQNQPKRQMPMNN